MTVPDIGDQVRSAVPEAREKMFAAPAVRAVEATDEQMSVGSRQARVAPGEPIVEKCRILAGAEIRVEGPRVRAVHDGSGDAVAQQTNVGVRGERRKIHMHQRGREAANVVSGENGR